MRGATLARVLVVWALGTALACLVVHRVFALQVDEAHPRTVVASVWRAGKLGARVVAPSASDADGLLAEAAAQPGATRVDEAVVAEGPVLAWPEAAFALSFVAGRDGLSASLGGRTAYVTPDELLAMQAYDHGVQISSLQLAAGLDLPPALAAAAGALGVSVRDLLDHGTVRRVRVTRSLPRAATPTTPATLDEAQVRAAAFAMGRYLARGVDREGRFRYLVNAPTNQTLPGYDWPRHAGATYFVAQVAARSGDPEVAYAALRAAALLRDHALQPCGDARCVGDPDAQRVDVGSAALTVLALVEIARTKLDASYAQVVPGLTAFLRAQQRPDGELMHVYDRVAGHPVDEQLLYYTGEAAFALSRAHALLGDARDLEASSRALAYLVGPGWSFFGSRYYWGEEHWTCQAMDDLWDRLAAPAREDALDFCLGWHAYGRRLMYGPGDTSFDADGAYGVGPLVTPRLTPVGSRTEAALATLEAGLRAGRPAAELALLDSQTRRSMALLLRHQLGGPGGEHLEYLLADPAAVDGAMPGSAVDWQLRIDFAQHAGSALLRWLDARGAQDGAHGPLPPNE